MEVLRDGHPTKLSKTHAAVRDHASRTAGTSNIVYMKEWLEKTLSWGTTKHDCMPEDSKHTHERMSA